MCTESGDVCLTWIKYSFTADYALAAFSVYAEGVNFIQSFSNPKALFQLVSSDLMLKMKLTSTQVSNAARCSLRCTSGHKSPAFGMCTGVLVFDLDAPLHALLQT